MHCLAITFPTQNSVPGKTASAERVSTLHAEMSCSTSFDKLECKPTRRYASRYRRHGNRVILGSGGLGGPQVRIWNSTFIVAQNFRGHAHVRHQEWFADIVRESCKSS
jgi:hypothetical protein